MNAAARLFPQEFLQEAAEGAEARQPAFQRSFNHGKHGIHGRAFRRGFSTATEAKAGDICGEKSRLCRDRPSNRNRTAENTEDAEAWEVGFPFFSAMKIPRTRNAER